MPICQSTAKSIPAVLSNIPTIIAISICICLTACGGGGNGGGTTPQTPAITSVAVGCSPGSINTNQTSTCAATVNGNGSYSSAVTWAASDGTITSSGVFTPTAAGTATITATSTEDTTKSGTASIAVGGPTTTVYVAGFMTNSSGNPVAAEWQLVPGSSNATTKMLILPITSSGVTEEYTATGIAVSGSDVYVVGYGDYSGTQYTALYWVNGTLETLSANGGEFQATSIAVSGSDVYVAGTEGPPGYESPVYWVNGTVKGLSTPSGTVDPEATGIAVSGSDVYVSGEWGVLCGSGLTEGYCQTPGYWVNGTLKTLPLPSGWTNAVPTGIAASGSDVYLAGYEAGGNAAAYWVNGTLQTLPLPSGASWTIITGIAVSGSNVYVVGYGGDNTTGDQTAMFWVNGTLETLPLPSGMTGAEATGIAVSGSDVYVAGCAILGGFQPCSQAAYWVNGKPETLPLSSNMTGAEATGIAVSTQ